MYLVRRKSDGKYWRNRSVSVSGRWRPRTDAEYEEKNWSTRRSDCKPFLTRQAARSSRVACSWCETTLDQIMTEDQVIKFQKRWRPLKRIYFTHNGTRYRYWCGSYLYLEMRGFPGTVFYNNFDELYEVVKI